MVAPTNMGLLIGNTSTSDGFWFAPQPKGYTASTTSVAITIVSSVQNSISACCGANMRLWWKALSFGCYCTSASEILPKVLQHHVIRYPGATNSSCRAWIVIYVRRTIRSATKIETCHVSRQAYLLCFGMLLVFR
jgi:hypothetical protein